MGTAWYDLPAEVREMYGDAPPSHRFPHQSLPAVPAPRHLPDPAESFAEFQVREHAVQTRRAADGWRRVGPKFGPTRQGPRWLEDAGALAVREALDGAEVALMAIPLSPGAWGIYRRALPVVASVDDERIAA